MPNYPIVCLCCTQILTPKECVENLFDEDLIIFKDLKDKFLIKPIKPKKKKIRLPLKYKCKYKCADSKEIIHLNGPTLQKSSFLTLHEPPTDQPHQPLLVHNSKRNDSIIVAYSKFMNLYGRCNETELINICKLSGWLFDYKICPKADCQRPLAESTYKGKHIWRCYRCDSTLHLKPSTWFSNSKLGFYDILQLTFCWILDLTESSTMKITGKSKYTVIHWFSKCRKHAIELIEKFAWKIGGPRIHVDIDLVLFGRARMIKESRLRPQWYIGLVEQDNKHSLMVLPIEDCYANTLEGIITRWVEPGSIIHTDNWSGFMNLNNLGYEHIVYDSQSSTESGFGMCTNAMQKYWNLLRSGCPERGSKRKFLTSYMMSKLWRERNENFSNLENFQQFMSSTLNCKCLKVK